MPDAWVLAFDAIHDLSGLKHFSDEIVRGAIIAALHRRGVRIDKRPLAPETEKLISDATVLVRAGLVAVGFKERPRCDMT